MKNCDKIYPKTRYLRFGRKRFIFRDGVYCGWYFCK